MKDQYNTILEKIEREIKIVLPKTSSNNWIYNALGGIEANINPKYVDNINRPALDLIYRGGKRWRPLVTVLIALCYKKGVDIAYKLSPLVELIHNGTLLVDDIEDKAIERRGKKAIHLIYGDDVAINSGNHLYFIPTTILDTIDVDDNTKLNLYKSYTQNMRRLHFGQGLDIQWHNNLELIPTVEEYIQMCKFKTGCLASMAGEIGAICAGLKPKNINEIRTIWEEIGVSFQIIDDVRNLTTGNPGKHRGDDIVEGKKSLPVILFCNSNNSKELFKSIKKAKKQGIVKGRKSVERAINILETSGSIDNALKIGLELLNKNIIELESILPNSGSKNALISFLQKLIK